jgi:hypothetical protein
MAPSTTSASARNGNDSSNSPVSSGVPPRELELQRKRARDRKSQQAMRDRNKWTIQTLSDQVACLSSALEERTRALDVLETKLGYLESENSQLRTQNAALQLSLLGRENEDEGRSPGVPSPASSFGTPLWELRPKNTPASCIADQILQGFVDAMRTNSILHPTSPGTRTARFHLRPNLCSIVDEANRSDDEISNIVADVLRTYREIESLPKQVAVFYVIATLLRVRWLLDHPSIKLVY